MEQNKIAKAELDEQQIEKNILKIESAGIMSS